MRWYLHLARLVSIIHIRDVEPGLRLLATISLISLVGFASSRSSRSVWPSTCRLKLRIVHGLPAALSEYPCPLHLIAFVPFVPRQRLLLSCTIIQAEHLDMLGWFHIWRALSRPDCGSFSSKLPTLLTLHQVIWRISLWLLAYLHEIACLVISFQFTVISPRLVGEILLLSDDVEHCFAVHCVLLL